MMSSMNEDPIQEEFFARAARHKPVAPRPFHAPPTFLRVSNKTYADQGRAPDGTDEQGGYWVLEEEERRNGAVRCPDCSQILIAAHDSEVAREGYGFLVCLDLQFPYRLPVEIHPCHEGCLIACGRAAAVVD
jgi:hypothetical protein